MKKESNKKRNLLMVLVTVFMLLLCSSTVLAASPAVSRKQAKQIALKTANVKSKQVKKWIKIKLDNWDDDKTREWDVEFRTATFRYDMEINAKTGRVEDFEKIRIKNTQPQVPSNPSTPSTPQTPPATPTRITLDQAKDAAIKAAGIKSTDVTQWLKTWQDEEEWELIFLTADYRFEVDVNAYTGVVKDIDRIALPKNPPSGSITAEKAKEIALADARSFGNVSGNPSYINAKLDRDDGRTVYEVDIRFGRIEFEYEIDANSGTILSRDMDYDD